MNNERRDHVEDEEHEPMRVRVQTAAAIALVATVAGMLLGYEVARLDRDTELGRLWTRKEAHDGRSG